VFCPFCIYSKQIAESGETVKAYCETLLKQIRSASSTVWAQSVPFKAIFLAAALQGLSLLNSSLQLFVPLKNFIRSHRIVKSR
jgi:hypothetical protein